MLLLVRQAYNITSKSRHHLQPRKTCVKRIDFQIGSTPRAASNISWQLFFLSGNSSFACQMYAVASTKGTIMGRRLTKGCTACTYRGCFDSRGGTRFLVDVSVITCACTVPHATLRKKDVDPFEEGDDSTKLDPTAAVRSSGMGEDNEMSPIRPTTCGIRSFLEGVHLLEPDLRVFLACRTK